jgi:hypothetical protein
MMSLQEISDRTEIGELLARYSLSVDTGRWELLDTVFTPDAVLDYRSAGGAKGSLPVVRAWLAEMLPTWPGRQHLIGAVAIAFDGDAELGAEAGVTASFTDTLSPSRDAVMADVKGLIRGGGWYHHRMVRTPHGWRSREVVLEQLWRVMQ